MTFSWSGWFDATWPGQFPVLWPNIGFPQLLMELAFGPSTAVNLALVVRRTMDFSLVVTREVIE